jgi:hypothetical protein
MGPEFYKLLLEAPDSQLDASMKPLIAAWGDTPKAIQVLEVVDHCIFGALASEFIMKALTMIYEDRLKEEGITHESLVPLATWRHRV